MKIYRYAIALILALSTQFAFGHAISGAWHGALDVGGHNLNIVFHFHPGNNTMDSPDQNAKGIPIRVKYNNNDSISLSALTLGLKYDGRLLSDSTISGTFSQRGFSSPLVLKSGLIKRNRPQTPQSPFPYRSEDICFASLADSARLEGTLVIADSTRRTPVVIMVSGSGPQNRDEELMGHRPFAVIADFLARHGISSFRYDDRGVGASEGIRAGLTPEIEMLDALSALSFIKSKSGHQFNGYGVLGHSLGGVIAYRIAGERPDIVDFIVSIAGPAETGRRTLERQNRIYRPDYSEEDIAAVIQKGADASPWLASFIDYDPALAIGKIKCPVMALFGSLDTQVDASVNAEILKECLKSGPDDVVKIYPGLNHLMQHATTGRLDEYGVIEETISTEVLEDVSKFIMTQSTDAK